MIIALSLSEILVLINLDVGERGDDHDIGGDRTQQTVISPLQIEVITSTSVIA